MSKQQLERIEKEILKRQAEGGKQLMFDFDEALEIVRNIRESSA